MSLWFHLVWNSLASLDLSFLTLSSRSFQPIFLQIIFLAPSLSLFFFCSPSNINAIPFAVSSNVQGKVCLFCKFFFSLCCSAWVSPIVLSSNLLIYFSNSSTLLFKPSNVFFSAVVVLFGTSLLNCSLCLSVFLLSHFMVINFNSLFLWQHFWYLEEFRFPSSAVTKEERSFWSYLWKIFSLSDLISINAFKNKWSISLFNFILL